MPGTATSRSLSLWALRSAIERASLVPPRHHAVVHGWPDSEGNSLRGAAVLAGALDTPVYLLCEDRGATIAHLGRLALVEPDAARVIPVLKHTFRAFLLTATARIVLFTHGLFGAPKPGPKRLYVNLWHGHGPKRTATRTFETRIPSDLLIANTHAWGSQTAAAFGLPPAALANIGNPRQDAMLELPSREGLGRLGLSSDRPYVVWMPTFRGVREDLEFNWRDSDELSGASTDAALDALAATVRASGVDFRVKVHPLDRDLLDAFGEWRVTDRDLADAGLSLYAFLGGAAGLISDYSSVWVEYLALDRPLLLYCPDIESYRDGRGLKTPSMTEIAADLIVTDAPEVADFLAAIGQGDDWRPAARYAAAEALGLAEWGPCAARLVDVIREAAAGKGIALRLRANP